MGIRRINTLAGKLMNALWGTEIIHSVASEMTAFDEDVFYAHIHYYPCGFFHMVFILYLQA